MQSQSTRRLTPASVSSRPSRPRGYRRPVPVWLRLFRTGVVLALVLWLISLGLVIYYEQRDTSKPAHAIVVLGAAQYDGRPSPVLRARVDHAIGLWRRGLAPVLITTGGKGEGDTTTEAAVQKRYAISKGIPENAIREENESRSTSQSLRTVAGMMGENAREVILVSDPFHMFRLSILARRFGLHPRTSPTRTSPITANRGQFWRYTLQESIKAPAAFFMEFTDR